MKLFLKNKIIFLAKNHWEIQVHTILVCTLYLIKYGTLLESSIMLLSNIYSAGITHDDHPLQSSYYYSTGHSLYSQTLDEAKRASLFCCGVSNEEETFYNVVDRCQSRKTTWKSSDDEEDWNLKWKPFFKWTCSFYLLCLKKLSVGWLILSKDNCSMSGRK